MQIRINAFSFIVGTFSDVEVDKIILKLDRGNIFVADKYGQLNSVDAFPRTTFLLFRVLFLTDLVQISKIDYAFLTVVILKSNTIAA